MPAQEDNVSVPNIVRSGENPATVGVTGTNEFFYNAMDVSAGGNNAEAPTGDGAYTMILTIDGNGDRAIYAAGDNTYGQLGSLFTGTGSHVPVKVLDQNTTIQLFGTATTTLGMEGEALVDISAGGHHGLARTNANYAYTWGDGSLGQMGDSSFNSSVVAKRVLKGEYEQFNTNYVYLEGVRDISAGGDYTLTINMYDSNHVANYPAELCLLYTSPSPRDM